MEVRGKINFVWYTDDHEGEVLETFVTKTRDKTSALKIMRKAMKWYGNPRVVVTDRCQSYRAAMKEVGNAAR